MKINNHLLNTCEVISFDVFDTAIFRNVERPPHIFYFVGENIYNLSRVSPKQFVYLRVITERACRFYYRHFLHKEDIELANIYWLLGKLLLLPQKECMLIMKQELREEEKNIVPNREIVELIKSIRLLNKRIIFTSEMYLPFKFLTHLLKKSEIMENENQLYLSGAAGKRKRSGNLYKYVLENEKIPAEKLLHIGDNYEHDVNIPNRLGINALHYNRHGGDLTWVPFTGCTEVYRGIIRQTSEKTYNESSKINNDKVLNQISSFISGPLLFSYVFWVIQEAIKSKIETIYFLARDGQILFKIATEIKKRYNLDIEIRYLYASRHAWILPSLLGYDELANESSLFDFSKNLTLNMLFHRFKIENSIEEMKFWKTGELGLKLDEKLTLTNLHKAKLLFKDPEIVDRIKKRATQDFETLSAYLRQENVLNNNSFAIVDTGWSGSLPTALRRIFIKNGRMNRGFTAFYFDYDLFGKPNYTDIDNFRSFFKETNQQHKYGLRGELKILMELLTASDHESTFGYKKQNGKIETVFIKENLDSIFKWGIKEQHEIITQFCKHFMVHPNFDRIPPQVLYQESTKNFYHFLNNPTLEMATKVSQFPYNTQQIKIDKEYNVVCAPYQLSDFKTLIQSKNVVRPNDLWIQGSLALTNHYLSRFFFKYFYKFISLPPIRWLESKIISMIK